MEQLHNYQVYWSQELSLKISLALIQTAFKFGITIVSQTRSCFLPESALFDLSTFLANELDIVYQKMSVLL